MGGGLRWFDTSVCCSAPELGLSRFVQLSLRLLALLSRPSTVPYTETRFQTRRHRVPNSGIPRVQHTRSHDILLEQTTAEFGTRYILLSSRPRDFRRVQTVTSINVSIQHAPSHVVDALCACGNRGTETLGARKRRGIQRRP